MVLVRGGRTLDPGLVDFDEARFQVFSYVPFWEMLTHLAQIRNVADVITFPVSLEVFVRCRFARNFLDEIERFENRDGIVAASTQVIDFAVTRRRDKLAHEP